MHLYLVCGDPPTVNYATANPSTGPLNVSEQVTYTCQNGYELVGDAVLMCLINGQYYPDPPTCRISKI